jgi:4-amino-4-deoxy-L-arabinose transferase-like glycosyltransferase
VKHPLRLRARLGERSTLVRLAGIGGAMAVSAVMNIVQLSQNGYANVFYSAGVHSMLHSWHDFLFVSFDSGGLVSMDKPPLALWVQAASAKLFGFSALSLLLPEALMGVLAVALLYLIIARRLGDAAAFAAALALAVFPSFVAVSRANGVDPLLILLMVMACGAGIRACETGRWRTLLWCGALVGLAFNTKTLAAYLAVPGIALGYLVCAPGSVRRRIMQLLAAGLAMFVVSFSWIALVEATPASERPFVGSSTDNTELGLTFGYNGFGRVEGQRGGPGQNRGRAGARVPLATQRRVERERLAAGPLPPIHELTFPPSPNYHREKLPIPFGPSPGPLRLFGHGLGDQAGWFLPLALFGLVALGLALLLERRAGEPEGTAVDSRAAPAAPGARPAEPGARPLAPPARPLERWPLRRDPRLATLLVLGGWLLTEWVVLSASKGIVHPYYMSALGPAAGAMTGAGVVSLAKLAVGRAKLAGLALWLVAILATVAVEVMLLHREHYMLWFVPLLIAGAAACLGAIALGSLLERPQGVAGGAALSLVLVLIAPAAYSATTWLAPVQPTFPAAGPHAAAGHGGIGATPRSLALVQAVQHYVETHGGTQRFALLTDAADTAAPYMLRGMRAAAVAGYSGVDPVLDGPGLARLVDNREARYVLLGGEYSSRGGNGATQAVIARCREMIPAEWGSPVRYPYGLVLFDCAGRGRALASS